MESAEVILRDNFQTFIYLVCIDGEDWVPQGSCRDQRATCASWFSPSMLWVAETILRLPRSEANAFTLWATSPLH